MVLISGSRRAKICISLITLLLAGSACGPSGSSKVPGVTDTTITIGSHFPNTGISATNGNSVAFAAKAYFDYVNDHGGVNGRRIIFSYRDDFSDPGNSLALVRKIVEGGDVFAIFDGFGTAAHQTVVDYLNSKRVPDVFPISGCLCLNDPRKLPNTFAWLTNYYREGKILGSYVEQNFPGKKIAYFYQDDGVGGSGIPGLDAVIPASDVVVRASYTANKPESGLPAVRAVLEARPDVIISFSSVAYAILLRQEQIRTGNEAQLVVNAGGSDPDVVTAILKQGGSSNAAAESNRLLQGVITDAPTVPVTETSDSWVSLLRTIHDKYFPEQPINRYSGIGLATAYNLVEALQQAGRKLTRESLIEALEKGEFSFGLSLTPLDYSRASHTGVTGAQVGIIRDGVIVLQGLPMVTDDGNGPVTPYLGTRAPAPTGGIPRAG